MGALRAGSHRFASDLLATYRTRYTTIIDAGWMANPHAPRPDQPGPPARAGALDQRWPCWPAWTPSVVRCCVDRATLSCSRAPKNRDPEAITSWM